MINKILTLLIFIFMTIAGCVNYQKCGWDKSLFTSKLDYSIYQKRSLSMYGGSNVNGRTFPERKVISIATLTIEISRFQVAINEITIIMLDKGGFISSSSISDIGNTDRNGFLTLSVPQMNICSLQNIGII